MRPSGGLNGNVSVKVQQPGLSLVGDQIWVEGEQRGDRPHLQKPQLAVLGVRPLCVQGLAVDALH